MPTLSSFTNDDLPDHFSHQIRDFIRIHWFDAFQYDVNARAMPDEWQPVYFVITEGQALFSHAAVITRTVECDGRVYTCGGISSALTYPAFRKRGYGSQVLQAAADYLTTSTFDVSILWTDADKGRFYERFGWEHHPSLQTFAGDRDESYHYDAFTMIRLLSDDARQHQSALESAPIYIGEYGW
jgi:predicted acetyltransferase